jgi:hypothetical protein
MITETLKESIIAEKLTTNISYRSLGAKHNLCFRTVHHWVTQCQGKMKNRKKDKKVRPVVAELEEQMPVDVKTLQEDLRKARLMNEILNEVINIAEEELKIPIRKKFGAK